MRHLQLVHPLKSRSSRAERHDVPGPSLTAAARRRSGAFLAVAVVVSLGLHAAASAQAPSRLLITNVKVADLAAGRSRQVTSVLVEGQKIVAVNQAAPAAPPDGDVTRIDGAGATLVPALVDLSVQALPGGTLDADFYYALSLAHGVMRVRTVDLRLPWAAQQRDRVSRGEIIGPRLWTSGPAIDLRAPFGNRLRPVLAAGLSPFVQVTDSASAAREVERQASQGADWVRFREQVTPEALRGALKAARAGKVKVSLVPWATSMTQAAQLGVDLVDGLGSPVKPAGDSPLPAPNLADPHATPPPASGDPGQGVLEAWARLTPADQRTLVNQLARSRTPVAPNLFSRAVAAGRADVNVDLGYLPDSVRPVPSVPVTTKDLPAGAAAAFARMLEFVKALQAAGGRLVTASRSDAGGWPVPGLGVHREIQWLVAAGLTPAEALRAATTVAGEVLGERQAGQIRPGAPADFFAVKGDPFADVAALGDITLIVRRGEVLDRAQLLAQARRAGNRK